MANELKALHAGNEVHAWAQPLANGKFSPAAVVTHHEGSATVDTVINVPAPHEFEDGNAAATHALGCAIAWIDLPT